MSLWLAVSFVGVAGAFTLLGIMIGEGLEASRWRSAAGEPRWLESDGRVYTVQEERA